MALWITREIGHEKAMRTNIAQNIRRPNSLATVRWKRFSLRATSVVSEDRASDEAAEAATLPPLCGRFGEAMDTAPV
jgi:hypothetical protein